MKTIIIALLIAFACSTELNTVEEEQQLMWNPQGLVQFSFRLFFAGNEIKNERFRLEKNRSIFIQE